MNRQELEKYILDTYGVSPENPWIKHPTFDVFRHVNNKKWFAVIMDIPKSKLGINSDENICVVNLKCDTVMMGNILSEKGVYPAYHMNKAYWVTVSLDGSTDDDTVKMLTRMSFKLTEKKRKNQKQKENI